MVRAAFSPGFPLNACGDQLGQRHTAVEARAVETGAGRNHVVTRAHFEPGETRSRSPGD
jgi:hypothetical protein